jgi:hypothetical protein
VDHDVVAEEGLTTPPARDVGNRGIDEGITAALHPIDGFVVYRRASF